MKTLTTVVALCVAGIVATFAGSIYTGIRIQQEKDKPQPSVFPTPATQNRGGVVKPAPAPTVPGALPTPAH